VLKVNYDKDGGWLGFEEITDKEKVGRFVKVRGEIMESLKKS